MESKKLPVLYADKELVHAANWPLYEYSVNVTTKPYQDCQEPYIPVARVREMMALMEKAMDVAEKQRHHSATTLHYWHRELEELIADVEDHEG